MKVLITGGHGFVGWNLVEHPLAVRFEIVTPTRKGFDLRDNQAVWRLFMLHRPEAVIHLAGVVGGIARNVAEGDQMRRDNEAIGLNVVECAYNSGVRCLINVASSCMYSPRSVVPFAEEDLLRGPVEATNAGYAMAKRLVAERAAARGFKTVVPPNLYGKYDRIDEFGHVVANAIRKVVDAKIRGESTVLIWGSGTPTREVLYAGDLADFLWKAVRRYEELPLYLNVGTGTEVSIRDLYETVKRVHEWDGEFSFDASKPDGIARKVMDMRRLQTYGWTAPTGLDDGLRTTINWYLSRVGVEA